MMRYHPVLIGTAAVGVVTLLTLALLEIALQFMPVRSYLSFEPVTYENPVLHYPPHIHQVYSAGWNFDAYNIGTTNAQGYLADQDFVQTDKPVIGVVGDSFIEARMVPFAQTLQGRLQEAAGDSAAVYGVGIGGSPLSQYLIFARWLRDHYKPAFMVVNIVSNDFDESLPRYKNMPRFHYFVPDETGALVPSLLGEYKPSWIKELISHSALVRYAYFHLELANFANRIEFMLRDLTDGPGYASTLDTGAGARLADSREAVDAFLRLLPEYAGLPKDRILLLIDGQRSYIYDGTLDNPAVDETYFGQMRAYTLERARAAGFAIIDMEPVFAADYAAHGQRFDFPLDAHWNGDAHGLAAQKALENPALARVISPR